MGHLVTLCRMIVHSSDIKLVLLYIGVTYICNICGCKIYQIMQTKCEFMNTGKGLRGVGLVTVITKDVTTGDLIFEGEALVLVNIGICVIDEFDK